MRRADRLLQIVQIIRRSSAPITAQKLADELEVAKRTIYRDIADLQASRVPIDGEAGVGYILRSGYDLPPLMFNKEQLEAIALGMSLVADRGDALLACAAHDVLAKISSVLPNHLADHLCASPLLVPHRLKEAKAFGEHLPAIRLAIRDNQKLSFSYCNSEQQVSQRTVWPLGLYLYSHVTIVCAWCELRNDFRAFRADRINACIVESTHFNAQRGRLFQAFLAARGAVKMSAVEQH